MKQEVNVQVMNVTAPKRIGFFAALMWLGLFLWLWKFLLVAVIVVIAAVVAWYWFESYQRGQKKRLALCQRADLQHAWVLQGDPWGMYGREMYGDLCYEDWWELHCGLPGPDMTPLLCKSPMLCKNCASIYTAEPPRAASQRIRHLSQVNGKTVERH